LGSNEFSFGKGSSSPKKRAPSLRYNVFSLNKGLNSLGKHMFQIFLQSQPFHVCFYISLWLIIGKVLKRATTLLWKHSNQNSYAKIVIKQNFKHICSSMNMVVPLGNLSFCSPRHMVVPRGNLNSFSSGTWLFPKIFL
jgi:hypothetical protein